MATEIINEPSTRAASDPAQRALFGQSVDASGSGTWVYPTAGSLVGLLMQVLDVPANYRHYVDRPLNYQDLGYYQCQGDEGAYPIKHMFEGQRVELGVGMVPLSIGYNWKPGVRIRILEIISFGVRSPLVQAAAIRIGQGPRLAVQANVTTQIPLVDVYFSTRPDLLDWDGATRVLIKQPGVYRMAARMTWLPHAGGTRRSINIARNTSAYLENECAPISGTAQARGLTYWESTLNAGDTIGVRCLHDGTGPIDVADTYLMVAFTGV